MKPFTPQRAPWRALIVALGAAVAAPAGAATFAGWHGVPQAPQYQETVFPPWQHGANNPASERGLEFTVPEVNDLPDFHGNPQTAKLVVFVGGNYFFAMAPLAAEFVKEHPEYKGALFYETLPPGILLRQMAAGGTITIGNMSWTVRPDVYAAGLKKVQGAIDKGLLAAPAVPYVTNDLTIMVPAGNPAHVTGLADLGKPGVRLTMPNPEWEGVARQIKASLGAAGGAELTRAVYEDKVRNGQTVLTHVHHRQTPLFLMQGVADAGVTWRSEAIFQEQAGHPISHVDIPASQNTTAIYAAAVAKDAPHPEAGKLWVEFLRSPTAVAIFKRYGFHAYAAAK